MADFKPNIYPIMYWGLLYGLVAGFVLLAIYFLSQFITVIWFPVFLAGLIYGGYRNYQRQKRGAGAAVAGSPLEEFRNAAQDIASATREMIAEQQTAADDDLSEQELAEPLAAAPPAAPPAPPTTPQPPPAPQ